MQNMQQILQSVRNKKTLIIVNSFLVPFLIVGLYTIFKTNAKAQSSCVASSSIASDSRCLYVMNGNVYQKGSKSSPHQGHPCGMDVSSIIPSFHIADVAKYLDPNLVGSVCAQEQSTPTNTPAPTTPSNNNQDNSLFATTNTPVPDNQSQSQSTTSNNSSQQSAQSNSTNNTQMVYVYLPKPTQEIIYVTATPMPGVTYADQNSITINGTPPGSTPWGFYAFPIGLILLGFLL